MTPPPATRAPPLRGAREGEESRSALPPTAVADLRLERMRVGPHDHEQFAEQLGDLRIGRTAGRRPRRRLRHRHVVAAVDGIGVEQTWLAGLEAADAVADLLRAEIVGGVEH